jgi:hypothetical protein
VFHDTTTLYRAFRIFGLDSEWKVWEDSDSE